MKDGLLWGCWHYLLRFSNLISFTVKLAVKIKAAFCVRLKTFLREVWTFLHGGLWKLTLRTRQPQLDIRETARIQL